MPGGDYTRKRIIHQDVSSTTTVVVGTADYTLVTGRTNYTIFVQRIVVWIATSAAQSISFEDSTTGLQIANIPASPGNSTRWDFDFGPEGRSITSGESLVWNASAAGNIGHCEVLAYKKLDNAVAVAST
jgi:hypothetical protein